MKFRTRAMAAAIALPMILGVAACGETDKAGGGATQSAPTQTTSAPVTSSTPEVSTPLPPTAEAPLRLTNASFMPALKAGTGKAKSFKATAVMTVGSQKITMTTSQITSPLAMKLDMVDPAAGTMQMILVKSNLYLSIPKQTGAGKYIKLDLKNSKDPQIKSFGSLLDSADPMKSYQGWEKGLRSVKFVKSETIGGQKLDRYDVTVDTAASLKAAGQPVPKGVPKTLVYSVWMGSDKLIYRLTFSMAGVEMLMTMSDYNKPISITAPPANKIIAKR
ncbi:hypothetical protein [Streptomyces sp. SID13031]|uniref:hypothetical protein n=1 Tax=Streptomyces sp. SID13031 TaxID=2706046 RepID=UPI0013CB92F1|nr:hypothetical protein [Streptomyces sp. SID13031]NEA36087.1 hypothetical protein [Streptomyces sp. SID13031]